MLPLREIVRNASLKIINTFYIQKFYFTLFIEVNCGQKHYKLLHYKKSTFFRSLTSPFVENFANQVAKSRTKLYSYSISGHCYINKRPQRVMAFIQYRISLWSFSQKSPNTNFTLWLFYIATRRCGRLFHSLNPFQFERSINTTHWISSKRCTVFKLNFKDEEETIFRSPFHWFLICVRN